MMGYDVKCCKCGYYRGHPNRPNGKFICRNCRMDYDDSDERAERRLGA